MGKGPWDPQNGTVVSFPRFLSPPVYQHRAKESSHLETQTNTDKNNPMKPALSRQRTRKGAARQDKKL